MSDNAKKLREWADRQDAAADAADAQWRAITHAETATFLRSCALEIEELRTECNRLRASTCGPR